MKNRVVLNLPRTTGGLEQQPPNQTHRPTTWTICVVAFLSVFTNLPSRSEASPIVLYNNFGPGQSYSLESFDVAGANSFLTEEGLAEPFTPTITTTFDAVLLPLDNYADGNFINVSLVADVGGGPGPTPLVTFSDGMLPYQNDGTVIDLAWNSSLGPDPVLTAGTTYWITATVPFYSVEQWFLNTTGARRFDFGVFGFDAVGPSWVSSTAPTNVAPAMEVLGNTVSTPEPSAFAMLAGLAGMGAIGLTWVRRRAAAH
jgi:hypothetical protein